MQYLLLTAAILGPMAVCVVAYSVFGRIVQEAVAVLYSPVWCIALVIGALLEVRVAFHYDYLPVSLIAGAIILFAIWSTVDIIINWQYLEQSTRRELSERYPELS